MVDIKHLHLKNKIVFLRCDFNLPIHNRKILSDLRIRESLQTIEYVLSQNPKQLILASHWGRPKEKNEELSLQKVVPFLKKYLDRAIYFQDDITQAVPDEPYVVLLENLRFWPEEKKGSLVFAKQLKKNTNATIYINDAFGTAHRKDMSVYAFAKQFSVAHKAYGFLVDKELQTVNFNYSHPIITILGPAKIADKLPLFESVCKKSDKVLLCGGVVFTFLKAMGVQVGHSLVDVNSLPAAKKLYELYKEKIILPTDFIALRPKYLAQSLSQRTQHVKVVNAQAIPKSYACFDIGPNTVDLFSKLLEDAKTVVWNGPVGFFEKKPFDKGTKEIAKMVAKAHITSLVCGGDTAAALKSTRYKKSMTYISTGGGASLQLLSGKKLPALQALKN